MTREKKAYRSSPEGSFMIDREFRGIGRIHMASGLYREAQFNLFNDGLTEMARDEQKRPYLVALKERRVTPIDLFAAIKANDFTLLAVGPAAMPLVAALERWREATRKEVSTDTYRVRGELVDHVRTVARPDARVASLADVLRVLRVQMRGTRSFNLDLSYARAFVRDTLGRRHPLYADVADITPRKKRGKTERHPLSPIEVMTVAGAFDRVWKSKKGRRGDEVLAMAMTGMHAAEYWGAWRVLSDRVHIEGTKRAPRVRDVPRLFPSVLTESTTLARPAITETSFARALNIASIATGIECTPYDLRRTFANWLEAAGILRARRRLYLGHQAGDVTDLYEQHDVTRFLADDGAKVRAWLAASMEGISV